MDYVPVASSNWPATSRTPTPRASIRSRPLTLGEFADYELLAEVGHGGMGVVYQARQKSLDRIVALKMLLGGQFADPQARARFRSEAEITAQLQHPNIVAIHEVGEHDHLPFFTMDYVEGRSLAEVARDRPLSPAAAAGYWRPLPGRLPTPTNMACFIGT